MTEDDSDLKQPLELPGEEEAPKQPHYSVAKPRRSLKKPLIILVVVLVIAAIGYGGYKLFFGSNTTPPQTNQAPQQNTSQQATNKLTTGDVPKSTDTKEYKSETLGFTLTYPTTWTVSTTTDNGVRVTSPDFKFRTVEGKAVSGNFRLYIRTQARESDSKYIGRGVAIIPSEKLTYTKPTSTQRKDTLVSSFGLDTTNNFAFLLVAGNFQLAKGDSLGPNYGKEAGTFIIGGGYSGKELTDDLATYRVPTDWYNTTNAYNQALDIIKSLQLL
jgi:hypothetical protein